MKYIILFVACIVLNSKHVSAEILNSGGTFYIGVEPQISSEHLKTLVNNLTTELSKVNASRADSHYCDQVNNKNSPTPKCIETYTQIYAKPTVEVRIVLGYSDASDNPKRFGPHDLVAKEQMVNLLTKDCDLKKPSEGFFLCGFARADDDANLFTKKVAGPNGVLKTVNLILVNSSVSTDDGQNQGALLEQQLKQTELAKKIYLDGMRNADIILYNGHSRKGGGPDFAPAKRLKDTHIDYSWYQSHNEGFTNLLDALKSRTDGGPKLVGFFSCDSADHFSKSIAETSPKTGFIGTLSPPSWDDSHRGVLTMLNAILGKICDKSLSPALNQKMDVKNNFIIQRFWN
jgi:hypothetical protein